MKPKLVKKFVSKPEETILITKHKLSRGELLLVEITLRVALKAVRFPDGKHVIYCFISKEPIDE